MCTSTHSSRQDWVVAMCARHKGGDNHKWVGTTANETEYQFTDSLSTSTKQLGVFASGPSSLISSRKNLQIVEGDFSRQKRRLKGSSSLVGTLDRTMFAFDLCTATLMRWKSHRLRNRRWSSNDYQRKFDKLLVACWQTRKFWGWWKVSFFFRTSTRSPAKNFSTT